MLFTYLHPSLPPSHHPQLSKPQVAPPAALSTPADQTEGPRTASRPHLTDPYRTRCASQPQPWPSSSRSIINALDQWFLKQKVCLPPSPPSNSPSSPHSDRCCKMNEHRIVGHDEVFFSVLLLLSLALFFRATLGHTRSP